MKGPEVAAPAAPAAKSLESAGYPQRRVTACIQTDSKPRRHKKMAVSRGKHPSTPTPPSFTSGPHLRTRSAANCGACSYAAASAQSGQGGWLPDWGCWKLRPWHPAAGRGRLAFRGCIEHSHGAAASYDSLFERSNEPWIWCQLKGLFRLPKVNGSVCRWAKKQMFNFRVAHGQRRLQALRRRRLGPLWLRPRGRTPSVHAPALNASASRIRWGTLRRRT